MHEPGASRLFFKIAYLCDNYYRMKYEPVIEEICNAIARIGDIYPDMKMALLFEKPDSEVLALVAGNRSAISARTGVSLLEEYRGNSPYRSRFKVYGETVDVAIYSSTTSGSITSKLICTE